MSLCIFSAMENCANSFKSLLTLVNYNVLIIHQLSLNSYSFHFLCVTSWAKEGGLINREGAYFKFLLDKMGLIERET